MKRPQPRAHLFTRRSFYQNDPTALMDLLWKFLYRARIIPPMDDFEKKINEALAHPNNQGEMTDADSVGTVGSPDCGDMMRMWLKFSEKDGKKIIDRASFQAFGCQTAIAVASIATQLLRGKTAEEARHLSAQDLAGDLGTLPPMKIHCGQLVEGALRNALDSISNPAPANAPRNTLINEIHSSKPKTLKIVPLENPTDQA